ncbi:MAG: S41 family peptidase [Spirochaetales bacterium]|nr:S41 family peptidase [Spirochaetales bacterium]
MKNKERIVWAAITTALALAFILTTASPMRASSSGSENEKYIEDLAVLFNFVERNYVDEVSPQQLYEGAAKGLFESLNDPYSVYLTPEDMEEFTDMTTGSFGGVGLFISRQGGKKPEYSSDLTFRERFFDYVEIISPIEGTPAYKAGMSAGDFIIAIDGKSAEGFTSSDASDLMRGKPGTEVEVTIARRGNITKTYKLKRAVIEVPTTKYAMLSNKTAYLRIIRWTPYTPESVKEALKLFKDNGYNSLVLDVRGNPGGLLSSVVKTADLFLSKGTIVSTKDRNLKTLEEFKAKPSLAISEDIPIILLTDKGSASASEILSGALKDTGRAFLIGDTTYGKGSVQQIRNFLDSGFKITISRYYTPNDYNIDKIGIEPNLKIKDNDFTDEELEELGKLVEANLIPEFVSKTPDQDKNKIDSFVKDLEKQGYDIEERYIRKMIREEYNRTVNNPPVFDLDYDTVLKKALDIFQNNEFNKLMAGVK